MGAGNRRNTETAASLIALIVRCRRHSDSSSIPTGVLYGSSPHLCMWCLIEGAAARGLCDCANCANCVSCVNYVLSVAPLGLPGWTWKLWLLAAVNIGKQEISWGQEYHAFSHERASDSETHSATPRSHTRQYASMHIIIIYSYTYIYVIICIYINKWTLLITHCFSRIHSNKYIFCFP